MKRWKSEMLQNYLENTWLDGRNAANSVQIRGWTSEMLQIACKTEGLGHHLRTHTIGGGAATQNTAAYIHISYCIGTPMSTLFGQNIANTCFATVVQMKIAKRAHN